MFLAAESPAGSPGLTLLIHAGVGLALTAAGAVGVVSVSPFFADTASGGEIAAIVAISGIIGAAGKWAADQLVNRRKDQAAQDDRRRMQHKEDKAEDIARLERLLERETAERKELQVEVKKTTERAIRAEIKANRAEVWIQSYEGVLRHHKIEFVPFGDESDDELRPDESKP